MINNIENRQKLKAEKNGAGRLENRLKRLEAETKQAKEKLREHESEQARIRRLQIRRRIEHEQRLLGQVAYAAGFALMRTPVITKEGKRLMVIDADLIAGAMELLASQMNPPPGGKKPGQEELDDLRKVGRKIRNAYRDHPENPNFRIPQVGIVDETNIKGERNEE